MDDDFTRMGWEHPMKIWGSYLQTQVNYWDLPSQSLSQFSGMREGLAQEVDAYMFVPFMAACHG